MKDSIILGTGNSRYLKSVENFKALYPTYDDFAAALVAGALPVDFNGINPAGFQQVGNVLGKAALLKDDTAALYGLPNTAVPDDALRLLAPAVSHWWRRRSYQMAEVRTALPNELNYIAYGSNADNCVRDVQYASEVALFYGGGVELIDPQEVQVKWNDGDATTEVLKGMYVFGTYSHPDDVLYFDTDEVFSVNSSSSAYWVRSINTASYLVSAKAEYGAWEYVHSSDEDAYPHSGAADGYEYEYLGQPYPPKAGSGGTGTCSVLSVNGKTGDVKLTAGDVGAVSVPATASVGQTIVVKAVDETGKPTAWEAADMAGGKYSPTLPLVASITLTEEVSMIEISTDKDGNPLSLEELDIWMNLCGGASNVNRDSSIMYFNGINTAVGRIYLGENIGATGLYLESSQYFVKREYGSRVIGQYGYGEYKNNKSVVSVNMFKYIDAAEKGKRKKYPKYTQINLYPATDGYTFGAGTQIDIYGR